MKITNTGAIQPLQEGEDIKLHVDLFTATGKWKYGFDVVIPYKPLVPAWETLTEIDRRQNDVIAGTMLSGEYHVVIDHAPQEALTPMKGFFMKRLYTNRQVIHAMLNAPAEVVDACPDCKRAKAHSAPDIAKGKCPKWYAVRDPDAKQDCINFAPGGKFHGMTKEQAIEAAKKGA